MISKIFEQEKLMKTKMGAGEYSPIYAFFFFEEQLSRPQTYRQTHGEFNQIVRVNITNLPI